jgi:DMSO/TMAO reductase YedYZ molybdopterin-dependent catalytic subunit
MVTSSCTDPGGRPGAQRWTGVSLQRLLPALGAKPSATHLKIRSTSGFFEMVSMQAIRSDDRVMLTYAWDGAPLPDDRGFPLRIYIPNCSAMKRSNGAGSNGTSDRELGYWIERGWDDPLSINPERQVLGRKSASR